MDQMEFHLVYYHKENYHYDHNLSMCYDRTVEKKKFILLRKRHLRLAASNQIRIVSTLFCINLAQTEFGKVSVITY